MTDERETVSEAMSILGSRTSNAKARAARENGRLGGRPKRGRLKKVVVSPTKVVLEKGGNKITVEQLELTDMLSEMEKKDNG
jgi:hypothetical protein